MRIWPCVREGLPPAPRRWCLQGAAWPGLIPWSCAALKVLFHEGLAEKTARPFPEQVWTPRGGLLPLLLLLFFCFFLENRKRAKHLATKCPESLGRSWRWPLCEASRSSAHSLGTGPACHPPSRVTSVPGGWELLAEVPREPVLGSSVRPAIRLGTWVQKRITLTTAQWTPGLFAGRSIPRSGPQDGGMPSVRLRERRVRRRLTLRVFFPRAGRAGAS